MSRKGENIRKRKDGRWEGRYPVYSVTGKKKILRSIYGKTYSEVKEKLLYAKTCELDKHYTIYCGMQEYDDKTNICFGTIALDWLDNIRLTKKYSTYIKYMNIYNRYLIDTIGEYDIIEVTDRLIRQEVVCNPLSESIERSIYCVINQIFDYAGTVYHIEIDRAKRSKSTYPAKPATILSENEQFDLLDVLYKNMDIYKVGVLLCMSTGLRLGEICSLKWSDIDFETRVLHVNRTVQRIAIVEDGKAIKTGLLEGNPKSLHSNRYIPLPDALYELICNHRTGGEYFFNTNKPMEPRTYQKMFRRYLEEAGVSNKNFHALRHTFATNLVIAGADVKTLSEILGHANVQITLNRYVHPSIDNKRTQLNSLFSVRGQKAGRLM